MRFIPAEPDIATVFGRITDKDIDLQPDFQRGEVWPTAKKQRLVDSVLRGWVIPPVLLITGGAGQPQQVLDGQQRLASIRDFMLNEFPIDGFVEPADPLIQSLNGLRFNVLPPEVRRAFLRTPVRMYEIMDYKPEEPAEIFFRLNQPTGLTPAEKRNAFFGPVRDEIRRIVDGFEEAAEDHKLILGFSNSRMAYDDVFARFACTLEMNTLRTKVTAAAVNQMYRRNLPLRGDVLERLELTVGIALKVFEIVKVTDSSTQPRLNKATFFSWLLFFSRLDALGDLTTVAKFLLQFETVRLGLSNKDEAINDVVMQRKLDSIPLVNLMLAYTDRASARVADVTSVVLRDFALWASWSVFGGASAAGCLDPAYSRIPNFVGNVGQIDFDRFETVALQYIDEIGWGARLQHA
ncbi:MAG: DUF262 domain-containing protein [Massilia sp.]